MKAPVFFVIFILSITISVNAQIGIYKNTDDTILLAESLSDDDVVVNEYLKTKLAPIRKNFKQLNSIEKWTNIKTVELWESTEGGEAKFYYQNKHLRKIITRHFGETFQKLTEYYLKDGSLSFVFEKLYRYNNPIYFNDSIAKQENNDTEAFHFEKSKIIEQRSYFNKRKLLHQSNNQDCVSPFSSDYLLEEQNRLLAEFRKLIERRK